MKNLFLFLLVLMGLFQGSYATSLTEEKIWNDASLFLFNEAHEDLKTVRQQGRFPEREENYIEALLLLNVQPKTEENIQRSAELFRRVEEVKGDDERGIAAKYYRGRIMQIHQERPDLVRAEKIYKELLHDFPLNPISQRALIQVVLLRLYGNLEKGEIFHRLEEVEELKGFIRNPSTAVCYHELISDYMIRFGGNKEVILNHLIAAEQAGIHSFMNRADTYVRMGMIARELGKRDVSILYFSKFLKEFQRDARHYQVQMILREMGSVASK
ncbi:MAG: hypothetical protein V4507_08780 [Verrucomicrobiota bacterium]